MKLTLEDVLRYIAVLAAGALTAGATLWGISAKAQAITDKVDQQAVALADFKQQQATAMAEVKVLIQARSDDQHRAEVRMATFEVLCCPRSSHPAAAPVHAAPPAPPTP